MKVGADTHVLVFSLFTPDRLTDTVLEVLLEAENTDGIVVSAATLADLWYASQKTSSPAIAPGVHEQIQATPGLPTAWSRPVPQPPLDCRSSARSASSY